MVFTLSYKDKSETKWLKLDTAETKEKILEKYYAISRGWKILKMDSFNLKVTDKDNNIIMEYSP